MARLLVFQRSLARSTLDLLDLEYRRGFSDLTAIAADNSENLDGLWIAQVQALLSRRVLKLFVEEPLVDLDPGEASGLDRSLALLAIDLAPLCLAILVESHEVADLVATFAQPVGLTHVVTARLSHAFS